MQTHNLGYLRIGNQRELKKACEKYWSGKISVEELKATGKQIRQQNWQLQKQTGIDLIPANDFSFYDQVLDMTLVLGAIPERYSSILSDKNKTGLDVYFAMARGYQNEGFDITAMEMTKWFDTNYHYIVPEFYKNQKFKLFSSKITDEFIEAKEAGIHAKPVIIGPVSYLLLGKEKEKGFDKLDLIENILPVYIEILQQLQKNGATYIQFDEPCLALDLQDREKDIYKKVYNELKAAFSDIHFILASYFECYGENLPTVLNLPVQTLHVDLVRCPEQLETILSQYDSTSSLQLSLGVVDGRNIWKNDFEKSLSFITTAIEKIGKEKIWIAPSCSLMHSPCDLNLETNESVLKPEIKQWMAFAKQKLEEIVALKTIANNKNSDESLTLLETNRKTINAKNTSMLIHNNAVQERLSALTNKDAERKNPFSVRKKMQQQKLNLPLYPTTTIGSFPQTKEVRSWRAAFKKGNLTEVQYNDLLQHETERTIRWQEQIGIDVLVHGEYERNDMVEYFGEQLAGFAFTQNGWVQSYGSRCVKPPIIYGDVSRTKPMTVKWSEYAQSLTDNYVKGMLTGPVTILQWSFVRNDQPRSETCKQIALAIHDEVVDLEKAGIKIIQIDEPAIREGLPLRRNQWDAYLKWAVESFRISASGVNDETQIHTHMCYSEFNDIIKHIADMDADVITIECSRSQMELLDAFSVYKYPNEIGPGVYDIHSPRVPTKDEILQLMKKAKKVIPSNQLWVNPDCGLKTRHWEETEKALIEMVQAAKELRVLENQQ